MNRTVFLVDGFNVYHSLKATARDSGGKSTKWLDLRSLLTSYLAAIGQDARLTKVYYFSALAFHLEKYRPGVTARHRAYVACLEARGIVPILGRFKHKSVFCPRCRQDSHHYEEKETDVAIAVKLMEMLLKNEADTLVLVTGDTDLVPAVRAASRLFPSKSICIAFPYRRKNKELAQLVSRSIHIRRERYLSHQLPNPVILPGGRRVRKPSTW